MTVNQLAESCGKRVNNLWHFDDIALSIFAAKVRGIEQSVKLAVEPVTRIPLMDGKYLNLEPSYRYGPLVWVLYSGSNKEIRNLDEYESNFVNAALKAGLK